MEDFGFPSRYTHSWTFATSSGSKDLNTLKLAIGHNTTGKPPNEVEREELAEGGTHLRCDVDFRSAE